MEYDKYTGRDGQEVTMRILVPVMPHIECDVVMDNAFYHRRIEKMTSA